MVSEPGEYRWGREGEILACPWHGWEFDLLTGEALVDRRKRLRLYPVTVRDDTVYVVRARAQMMLPVRLANATGTDPVPLHRLAQIMGHDSLDTTSTLRESDR